MITKLLKFEEGYRSEPYYCSEGYPTIGIGQKIGTNFAPLSDFDFTVSEPVAELMLSEHIEKTVLQLEELSWFMGLNESRQSIIISMAYQLGLNGLLKFKNMISAIEREDWAQASTEGLDSLWARQTTKRATRHMQVMKEGNFDCYEGLLK